MPRWPIGVSGHLTVWSGAVPSLDQWDTHPLDPVGNKSITPVHDSGNLADYRAPTQSCLLCPDFLQPATGEEPAHPTLCARPERLVEVVERGARGQRRAHRSEPKSVS